MIKDKRLLNFILTGLVDQLPFGALTTRMDIDRKYENLKGLNKKNKVYEVVIKDNVLFYVGRGTRGALEGIRIFQLQGYQIKSKYIKELLNKNELIFEEYIEKGKSEIKIKNGVKLIFIEINDENILSDALRAKTLDIMERMMLM